MLYHNYLCLSLNAAFPNPEKILSPQPKAEFIKKLRANDQILVYGYALTGLKGQSRILLWIQSESIEKNQDFINSLLQTKLGRTLQINATYFGMVRPSIYGKDQNPPQSDTASKGKKYLIIYPFTKTPSWYALEFEKRRTLMGGHVSIGKKYPQIEQLLLYSFGIDDSEFIVSYETDDLLLFQSLVMEMRSDKVREYALTDIPIYTCISKPLEEVINYL